MQRKNWVILLVGTFALGIALNSPAQEAAKNAVSTRLATTTLSGYVSTSYRWTPSSFYGNDAYKFSGGEDKRDRFSLDVVSLSIGSPAGSEGWSAGYNVQMWLGPDAKLLETDDSIDTAFAIKEAYVTLRIPAGSGLDLKVGAFDTIIGYEDTDRNLNSHFSHSWGKTIEPHTHTGFLFGYKVNGWLGLQAGLADSMGPEINALSSNDNRFTQMVAATFTVPDSLGFLKGSEITTGYINGREPSRSDTIQNFYLGVKDIQTPIENVRLGMAWDVRKLHGSGNDDHVIGGYLSYQATDLIQLNLRGEIFEAGSVLSAFSPAISDGWGITTTADYNVWENAKARFEYRHDHTDQAVHGKTGNHALIWNLIYEF